MRISKKYNLIFVSTPKCGSHTGWKIMENYFPPINYIGMHKKIVPPECVKYNAFTFVRHPFDRAVSLWHSMLHGHPVPEEDKYRKIFLGRMGKNSDSFEDFCKHLVTTRHNYNDFYSNFEKTIYEHNSQTNIEFLNIFKLENITELISYLKIATGITIEIPYEHKREHRQWDEIKTPKAREYLLNWAEKDFETYGYEM